MKMKTGAECLSDLNLLLTAVYCLHFPFFRGTTIYYVLFFSPTLSCVKYQNKSHKGQKRLGDLGE